jgi:hypothetical protein
MNVPRTLTPVNLVEVRQVKVDERGGAVDPGDLYDHAESPEALLHGVELSRYGLLGDIRRERCGAPPVPRDLLDRRVGQVDVSGVRHPATSNPSAASWAVMTRSMPPVPRSPGQSVRGLPRHRQQP